MGSIVASVVAAVVGAILAGATAVTAVNVAAPQFDSSAVEDGGSNDQSSSPDVLVPYGNR